jgi:hypothetical protein
MGGENVIEGSKNVVLAVENDTSVLSGSGFFNRLGQTLRQAQLLLGSTSSWFLGSTVAVLQ